MALLRNRFQFNGIFKDVFVYTGTFDPANAATGSGTFASTDVAAVGVALGDVVLGISFSVDTVDTVLAAAVTAADVITVTVLNNTAGAVNLASGTLRVLVGRVDDQVSFV